MTTFNIDGPVASITTRDKFDIVSLNGGLSASPTAIAPTGADVTIVLASVSGGSDVFQMSSSFNVGDVVEVYMQTLGGADVWDENGNTIAIPSGGIGNGAIYRKLLTGSGRTWGATRT